MFKGVRRRLIISYAAIFAVSLLLLGPVLYAILSRQVSDAFDQTLRLAAQRQAYLTQVPNGVSVGDNLFYWKPPPFADSNIFYLLLSPNGQLQGNPNEVKHAGLPDVAAAREAARLGHGTFSTLSTSDAGDYRLFTTIIKRNGRAVALLQAGQSLEPLVEAQRTLLYLLLGLGAAAVVVATVGGVALTRLAMAPINAAFAAQRAFIADASHELRTPLTLMRANAEVLLEADAVPDAEDRALVEDIVAEAAHMGRLVSDLLTLARLDAGALPLNQAPVDLNAVAVSGCRQMARLAERQGITVRCGVAERAPALTVRGDAERLEQALLILLDNAVKYTPHGGSVEVIPQREGTQATLAVRDTGRGVSPDEAAHLFARFHRGRGAGGVAEGSGLGLAIADGIVRAHQGSIRVRSAPGEGSTFTIALPLASRPDVGGALVDKARVVARR